MFVLISKRRNWKIRINHIKKKNQTQRTIFFYYFVSVLPIINKEGNVQVTGTITWQWKERQMMISTDWD